MFIFEILKAVLFGIVEGITEWLRVSSTGHIILLVKKLRLWQVPSAMAKYKAGRYRELGKLARYIRTDRITIRADRDGPVNIDGEIRMARNVQMKLSDKKIRFFYPKGLKYSAECAMQKA